MERICVSGLGYIGLPTAGVLATHGFDVLGVDVVPSVVETINSGNIHIEEPGLHTVVQAAINSGKLRAALTPEAADIFIVAVPTPLTEDKSADLSFVCEAAESLLPVLRKGALVILESTSPPGTCIDMLKPILEKSGLAVGPDIGLVHCPERVLPGKILKEFVSNDRIIGGFDRESAMRAQELYAHFVEGEIFVTDCTTAEMVKVTENTFRDVNIALANETALLCEDFGIDFWEVARLANRHPRVNVHSGGPGVGGHCISVDPWFLVERAPERAKLIHLARIRNDGMPKHVVSRVAQLVAGVKDPCVAALGLAYKGNVDDLRESPALSVVAGLREEGFTVRVHDPHVKKAPFPLDGLDTCLRNADCVVLLTDHDDFRYINPNQAARAMRRAVLYDTRNALDHDDWSEAGFQVATLGSGR